jgi:sRNA-binding protein
VFRAQAFEGIFALLPILLIAVVSVVLRARAAKRRKRKEETPAPARAAAPTPTQAEQKREAAAALPEKPRAPAPFMPRQPVRPTAAYREGYTYPPPMPLDNLKTPSAATPPQPSPVPEIRQPDLRERMKSRLGVSATSKEAAIKPLSVAARLERFPPLKRAVIWAEILGPPGGRQ